MLSASHLPGVVCEDGRSKSKEDGEVAAEPSYEAVPTSNTGGNQKPLRRSKSLPSLKCPTLESKSLGARFTSEDLSSEGLTNWSMTASATEPPPQTETTKPGRHAIRTVEALKKDVQQCLEKPEYNVHDCYHKEGLWSLIARDSHFESLTLAVISVNALWMAIDTDHNGAPGLLEAQPLFQIVEHFFCIYFSFEWTARFMSFARKADGFQDAWFVFDSCLVFFMVMETWVMTGLLASGLLGGGGGAMGNAAILRLLRLLRLSRLARMLRTMPELLIMIKGIAAATRSVMFTLCLLLIAMYIFAILFTQLSVGHDEIQEKYFASIPASMFTLLLTGTFLDNLGVVVHDMVRSRTPFLVAFFIFFIFFSAMTVLNMLIGVLCEVVSEVSGNEKEDLLISFLQSKMKEILDTIDGNGDGRISRDEFMHVMATKEDAIKVLQEVGVDPLAILDFANHIFEDELSDTGERELTFAEFLEEIRNFRGCNTATVTHMITLRRYLNNKFKTLEERLQGLKPPRKSLTACRKMPSASKVAESSPFGRMLSDGTESIPLFETKELAEILNRLEMQMSIVTDRLKVTRHVRVVPAAPDSTPPVFHIEQGPSCLKVVVEGDDDDQDEILPKEEHSPKAYSSNDDNNRIGDDQDWKQIEALEQSMQVVLEGIQTLRKRLPLGFCVPEPLETQAISYDHAADLRVWLAGLEEIILTTGLDELAQLRFKFESPPAPPDLSEATEVEASKGAALEDALACHLKELHKFSERVMLSRSIS